MIAAGSTRAQGAGFALKEQSAEYQGAADAGATARADDPSTLFFNPAGMAKLDGYQVSINASDIMAEARFAGASAHRAALLGGAAVSGTNAGDAAGGVLVPSFYGSAQLAPDWHVGLSVASPFGLTTKYDPASVVRYQALTSTLRVVDIAPAVAWQIAPRLALGATLIVEAASARLSNGVDFGAVGALAGLGAAGLLPGSADGIATVKGSDTGLGWQLGLLYEPFPGTRVGLDYRSEVRHRLTGSATFQSVPVLLASAFSGGRGNADLTTPASASVGVAQRLGRFTLFADFVWTEWSEFKALTVNVPGGSSVTPENWRDSAMISVGADYRLSDSWTLRAGVAYDRTPTNDQDRTPRVPDGNRYWLAVGATWRPLRGIALSAAYTHVFVDDMSVALADTGPGTPNFLRGSLSAHYQGQIDVVSLGSTFSF